MSSPSSENIDFSNIVLSSVEKINYYEYTLSNPQILEEKEEFEKIDQIDSKPSDLESKDYYYSKEDKNVSFLNIEEDQSEIIDISNLQSEEEHSVFSSQQIYKQLYEKQLKTKKSSH